MTSDELEACGEGPDFAIINSPEIARAYQPIIGFEQEHAQEIDAYYAMVEEDIDLCQRRYRKKHA